MIFSRALLSPARRAAKVSISSRALSGFGKLPASRCSASTRNFVAKNCSSVNSIHSTPWCYCMLVNTLGEESFLEDVKGLLEEILEE